MDLKSKLQRMLQIVEQAELNGGLVEIERDILLNELREAYTELKFGEVELVEPKAGVAEAPADPVAPVAPVAPIEESEEADEESEVEVELIFDESEDEEPIAEESAVEEPTIEEEPEAEETVVYEAPAEEEDEEQVEETEVEETAEEQVAEEEKLSALNTPLSTPKRSPILSLYEDNPTPVVGEQFHEAPSVADTISCPKGVAESTPITSLRGAIGLADKFMLIHKLFDGDSEAFDAAINALEEQPSFDDCVIYISEHFTWSPHSEATKLIMELLQRKYNA